MWDGMTAISAVTWRKFWVYINQGTGETRYQSQSLIHRPALSAVNQGPGKWQPWSLFKNECQYRKKHKWILRSGVCACFSPSCPELRRCSPRSQPNTLSRRMPLCFSFCLVGLDFMKERKKVISFPCFLDTEEGGREGRMHLRSLTQLFTTTQ